MVKQDINTSGAGGRYPLACVIVSRCGNRGHQLWIGWQADGDWLIFHYAGPTRVVYFLPLTSHLLTQGSRRTAFYCAHRATVIWSILPSSLVSLPLEWRSCWSHCGRRARLQMIPPSLLVISSGMGA